MPHLFIELKVKLTRIPYKGKREIQSPVLVRLDFKNFFHLMPLFGSTLLL